MSERDATERQNLANYESDWSVQHYQSETGLRDVETRLLRRYAAPPPARVLELGCGAGRATVGLVALGYEVTAIDLSWPLLAAAKRRYPELVFLKMDAAQLACSTGSFDIVLFSYNGIDVLSPLETRMECMREAFRVLKRGGIFQLSSHNALGTLWSAGAFHLQSYRNFAAEVAGNIRDARFRQWYWPYIDGGGPQWLYSAPPRRTARQLIDIGFEVVDVCGDDDRKAAWQVLLQHHHVHFVARRP
jgi:ubiquinone/menaquinone biosynthesis C-methylase UbiE